MMTIYLRVLFCCLLHDGIEARSAFRFAAAWCAWRSRDVIVARNVGGQRVSDIGRG